MDSILTSVKKMLGITEEYEHFDPDIIMHINSVFSILQQLGVGDRRGFFITDKSAVWNDFIISEDPRLNMVRSYMGAKVRSLFDPPQSGALAESLKNTIAELEWRLNVQVDPANEDNTGFDIVTATDEEVERMIDSLDELGGRIPDQPDAEDEDVEEIIKNLDNLDPVDPRPPYEDENTATDEEIQNLIDDLDGLGGHEPIETESNGEENIPNSGNLENKENDDTTTDSEEDIEATQDDVDGLIDALDSL